MRVFASFFRQRERELEAELRFHEAEQIKANLARGLSAEEARREAAIDFGGMEQIKEDCRDERRWVWVEQVGQDLRYAARQLRRSPGFTVVAVLTLALGIGASTAIFTLVNSVLFRPIPYPESERMVAVRESRSPTRANLPVSPANFLAWRDQSRDVFATLYAERVARLSLSGLGEPSWVRAACDTEEYFATLGVKPMLGRAFRAEEYAPGKDRVVVLNHGFWQRQFGGRPEAVGETIRLDGQAHTIVGVMPPEFQRDGGKDMNLPLALTDTAPGKTEPGYLWVFARLKNGVSLEQAAARMETVASELARQFPESNRGRGVSVVSILENRTADSRRLLFSLAGAVTLLLLIACTNVANLLLVRASAREREIWVRAALGASRWRIARQLLVESLLLALAGALGGLAVAKAGLMLTLAYLPRALPRPNFEIELDGRAVAVAVVLAVLTGLGFGLVPALQGSRPNRPGTPRPGEGGALGRARRLLARHGFVIAEIGLALTLLSGAGLLVRSFVRIAAFDPGIKPQGALVVGVQRPRESTRPGPGPVEFAEAVLGRFQALAGVEAVGVTQALPLGGGNPLAGLEVQGRSQPAAELAVANAFAVSPGYFAATGTHLLAGRLFTAQDRAGSTPVTIVSQSVAEELFPGANPIGQRVRHTTGPQIWREIVGVVGSVRPYGMEREVTHQTYTPFAQNPSPSMNFILRAEGSALTSSQLRQEIYAVDADQPVVMENFENLIMRGFERQRFALALFAVFSAIALLFAAVGTYSVVACSVARRRGEFGIRIALGARPADLFRFVMVEAGRIAGCGIVVGVLCTLALGRLLQSALLDTPAQDPVVFSAIAALLFAVALSASVIPARRAMKIDPLLVLRAE